MHLLSQQQLKFSQYARTASVAISLKATSSPPAQLNARRKPPIPAHKSMNVNFPIPKIPFCKYTKKNQYNKKASPIKKRLNSICPKIFQRNRLPAALN